MQTFKIFYKIKGKASPYGRFYLIECNKTNRIAEKCKALHSFVRKKAKKKDKLLLVYP